MDRGIFVAMSGAALQEKRLEVLSDNLANINTPGFKKQNVVFQDAMPVPWGPRTYAVPDSLSTDMSDGIAEETGRKLDVALRGDGFFAVKTPYGERYTRDGSFAINKAGVLTTKQGYEVLGVNGPVKLTSPNVAIGADGKIADSGKDAGKLKIVSFKNASVSLAREGNFFVPADLTVKPAPAASAQVEQGYIETSNLNAVRAMTTMIEVMRSYETHSKMIQTLDDMTKKSIEEVGRTA